jgi:hypothetical protein
VRIQFDQQRPDDPLDLIQAEEALLHNRARSSLGQHQLHPDFDLGLVARLGTPQIKPKNRS